MSDEEARRLIAIDANEKDGHGQHARDTFQLADVFLPMFGNEDDTRAHLFRFLDLVFGVPWTTPTQDEHGMFMAFAASLRSGSLARQVGAVITDLSGEVLATGANDAPRYGGGQYWPGVSDQRDSARGVDQNDIEKRALVIRVMRAAQAQFQPKEPFLDDNESLKIGKEIFADTGLLDITEFSREVHAEMAALSACSRLGTSVKGGTLYATTFPCHNCAKHIVAAGIKRVIFVEPYPKSKALSLHDDSIALMDGQQVEGKVAFTPFLGIGPRRFFDLFSMELSSGRPVKRKEGGQKVEWSRAKSPPRIPLLPYSYLQREQLSAKDLDAALSTLEQSGEGSAK
jgi:deoxycytidylate deaminase